MQLVSNALAQECAMGAVMVGYFMYYWCVWDAATSRSDGGERAGFSALVSLPSFPSLLSPLSRPGSPLRPPRVDGDHRMLEQGDAGIRRWRALSVFLFPVPLSLERRSEGCSLCSPRSGESV
jgi:hypothetical protein